MYSRRVIPAGRRGLPTPLTPAEKTDIANSVPTTQDDRLDALENPVLDGTRSVVGAHIGTGNQLGTPQRVIRYNCEFDVAPGATMLSLMLEGNAYAVGDIIALRYTGYWTGTTLAFGAAADLVGTRNMGTGVSPNGKPYVWFEAHNHLTTFTVDAMRHPLGAVLPKGSLNVHLTEAGTAWT